MPSPNTLKLREQLLKTVERKCITFTHDGVEYTLRELKVSQKTKVTRAGGMKVNDKGESTLPDTQRMQMLNLVLSLIDPVTKEQVFEESDVNALLEMPATSWVHAVGKRAWELSNQEAKELGEGEQPKSDSSSASPASSGEPSKS